jgi:lipoyl synthase
MAVQRLPQYLKKNLVLSGGVNKTKNMLRTHGLHTVCESARCPNISECFAMNRATFLIMGNVCTRGCRFCSIDKGAPSTPDADEPQRIADAVKKLGISHVVVTSVTRDDLPDGGAGHFYDVAKAVKQCNPGVTLELLTPDFKGDKSAVLHLLGADFDIFNHNVETVPSLYKKVRPRAVYSRSLDVLRFVKRHKDIPVKSGLMVGLGETAGEVKAVLADLKETGCDIVTIGQYLMPTLKHLPVHEYIEGPLYRQYEAYGRKIGIRYIYAGPFVRSSYHAQEIKDLIT